jgi:hypothetical protein
MISMFAWAFAGGICLGLIDGIARSPYWGWLFS